MATRGEGMVADEQQLCRSLRIGPSVGLGARRELGTWPAVGQSLKATGPDRWSVRPFAGAGSTRPHDLRWSALMRSTLGPSSTRVTSSASECRAISHAGPTSLAC
ncbi:hypothetical protein L1887_55227 [Cichorium endivia]|nr:hypothetical protein L1887_55227 [Cichorium endivia]